MSKKPYEELPDLEKLQKQWHKLSGLHTREEWSAAIVRAATAAEIAANFAIREEFSMRSEFEPQVVDSFLRWANGLAGKIDRLLIPLTTHSDGKSQKMKSLKKLAEEINRKRNAIAHQGEFCNGEEAKAEIARTKKFITGLVRLYDPRFALKTRQ